MRSGDELIVTKLDRLARSVADLIKIERRLTAKSAALKVLSPSPDTSTSTGQLSFNVIASVAQFERQVILGRQHEGIARAKREGKYKRRVPIARAKANDVRRLLAEGMKPTDVAKGLNISKRSVYRIIGATA